MNQYLLASKVDVAIYAIAKDCGVEISQVGVFLPPRIDDFDQNDRISYRFLMGTRWILGNSTFNRGTEDFGKLIAYIKSDIYIKIARWM